MEGGGEGGTGDISFLYLLVDVNLVLGYVQLVSFFRFNFLVKYTVFRSPLVVASSVKGDRKTVKAKTVVKKC